MNTLRVRELLLCSIFTTLCLGVAPRSAVSQNTDAPFVLATPGNTPTAYDNPDLVMKYQSTITAEDLAAHLYFFASDFFEGRETSTRGQKLAAHYLASQYRKIGVSPRGTVESTNPMDPSAYFQPFDVYGNRITSASLAISVNGKTVATSTNSAIKTDDQSYLVFGTTPNVTGGVVFGGYGIGDDDLGYNDFKAMEAAGISAEDSWLMVLADEPLASAEQSLLNTEDGKPSAWTTSRFRKISAVASNAKPSGILLVVDSSPRFQDSVAEAAARAAASRIQHVGSLSLEPRTGGGRRRSFPPVFALSTSFADQILQTTGKSIQSIQSEINSSLQPQVFAVDGVELTRAC